jgi:DNA ligase-1
MKMSNALPLLYKMNSRGKLQTWLIVTYNAKTPRYEVTHGQLGGSLQTTYTDVAEGKNIGKSNETTPYGQCMMEAKSMWEKKQARNGYSLNKPAQKAFRPMLAKSYAHPGKDLTKLKDGGKITFPCYYQPKLDGIRCCAFRTRTGQTKLTSRQGKEFLSLEHLNQQYSDIPHDVLIDGELYVHGEEFQDLVSSIKRDAPSANSHKIEHHVYDAYFSGEPHLSFEDRIAKLEDIVEGLDKVNLVMKGVAAARDEVSDLCNEWCGLGYEGIMLRNFAGAYKVDGRSADLQKVKMFQDGEYIIKGAVENKGKLKGTATFICSTEDGTLFKCIPEGTHAQRSEYWDNKDKYIHKMLTVRYFSMTTSDNPVPRFPIGVIVRDYD